ncbi:MAG: hypothetical protein WAT09_13300 [Paracoccaceae bacterium]
MKTSLKLAASAALVVAFGPGLAWAGAIDTACMRSGRDAANRSVCGCIQSVADVTLNRSDQRRAAKFFRDPDLAHKTWISQKPSDDAFWDRYKEFGAMAESNCAG